MRDLVEYYTKLIALRKSSAEWFDGDRVIVSVEGDEPVFRVGDHLVAVNPDVILARLTLPRLRLRRFRSRLMYGAAWVRPQTHPRRISAGDGDYLIVPPHTFAIWRLR